MEGGDPIPSLLYSNAATQFLKALALSWHDQGTTPKVFSLGPHLPTSTDLWLCDLTSFVDPVALPQLEFRLDCGSTASHTDMLHPEPDPGSPLTVHSGAPQILFFTVTPDSVDRFKVVDRAPKVKSSLLAVQHGFVQFNQLGIDSI